MPQTVACPHCTKALAVADNASGKPMRCPHCQKPFAVRFAVPTPATRPIPAAPPVPVPPKAPAASAPAKAGPARRCPTCQAELSPGARACLDCGTLLPVAHAPALTNGPPRPHPAGAAVPPAPQPVPLPPVSPPLPASPSPAAVEKEGRPSTRSPWLSLLPAALLGLALVITLGRDFTVGDSDQKEGEEPVLAEPEIDKDPRVALVYLPDFMQFGLTMLKEKDTAGNPKKLTFITKIKKGGEEKLKLTSYAVVRIDDGGYTPGNWFLVWGKGSKDTEVQRTRAFEIPFPGRFAEKAVPLDKDDSGQNEGQRSAWLWDKYHVRFTQTVKIVAGQPDPASDKRLLDTCLVHFTLKNEDNQPHKVGLRFILDTFIGANDGVPFHIPREKDPLIDIQDDIKEHVPDYIQALEFPRLDKPGTVAQVSLKLGGLEAPSRVSLTHYSDLKLKLTFKITDQTLTSLRHDQSLTSLLKTEVLEKVLSKLESLKDRELSDESFWKELFKVLADVKLGGEAEVNKFVDSLLKHARDEVRVDYPVPLADIRGNPAAKDDDDKKADSAVVLYWEEKELGPGKSREVGFAYGLGHIASGAGGKLGVTPPLNPRAGEAFALGAYVSDPIEGQSVELLLPGALKLVEGMDAKQTVPPLAANAASRNSQVTWRVKASKAGTYKLTVRSSTGEKQTLTVVVAPQNNIFR